MRLFEDDDQRVEEALQELENWPEYPYEPDVDRKAVVQLVAEFPMLDLAEEIRQWRMYCLDVGDDLSGRKVRHRARLRNWCRIASERRGAVRRSNGQGHAGAGLRARAESPEAYGPSGVVEW